jgi:hypothetical protein
MEMRARPNTLAYFRQSKIMQKKFYGIGLALNEESKWVNKAKDTITKIFDS